MGKKRIGEEWKEMKKKVREAIRGTNRELIKEEEKGEEWWKGVHKEEKRVEDDTEEMEDSWRKYKEMKKKYRETCENKREEENRREKKAEEARGESEI